MGFEWIWIALLGLKGKRNAVDMFAHLANKKLNGILHMCFFLLGNESSGFRARS
jgi:hypothetical protein